MSDEVWFCVCALNDCAAQTFGPFFSLENAQEEAATECENAHFTTREEPPLTEYLCPPTITTRDHDREAEWCRDRRARLQAARLVSENMRSSDAWQDALASGPAFVTD